MNPRERFLAVVNHRSPDRVPVDYGKHIGSFHRSMYPRLREHLGLPQVETRILDRMAQNVVLDEDLCQRLGLDFRWVVPHWVGVREATVRGECGYLDIWHTPHQYTDTGDYYAIVDQPLGRENLTLADISAFDWPNPDNPEMFTGLAEEARRWYEASDYVVGADGIKAGILQTGSQVRGYDRLFTDFALNPDLAHAVLDRIADVTARMYERYMNAVGRYVQVVVITDDQGTQNSLMVSPRMFRTYIKPGLARVIRAIKNSADVAVLMHCDGAITPIIEDLIEIGVDILNPTQTVVKGLEDTAGLKQRYGDRLCFHGAIDIQQFLPKATPDEVRSEVLRRMRDLGPNGGFILAPCHNINHDIPVENVVALFDAARECGHYPL